jgi:hypothetical protein
MHIIVACKIMCVYIYLYHVIDKGGPLCKETAGRIATGNERIGAGTFAKWQICPCAAIINPESGQVRPADGRARPI